MRVSEEHVNQTFLSSHSPLRRREGKGRFLAVQPPSLLSSPVNPVQSGACPVTGALLLVVHTEFIVCSDDSMIHTFVRHEIKTWLFHDEEYDAEILSSSSSSSSSSSPLEVEEGNESGRGSPEYRAQSHRMADTSPRVHSSRKSAGPWFWKTRWGPHECGANTFLSFSGWSM